MHRGWWKKALFAGFSDCARLKPAAAPGRRKVASALSLILLACSAALFAFHPLAAGMLLVQWPFSSGSRRTTSALMLSLVIAYLCLLYLLISDPRAFPWIESCALLAVIVIAALARARGGLIERSLMEGETVREASAAVDEPAAVYSRRRILALGAQELNRNGRTGDPLPVLFVHVDNFREIHDRLGGAAGNEALLRVSGTIREEIGPLDMIGRYGSEEFLVILADTGMDAARGRALRMQRLMHPTAGACRNGCTSPQVSLGLAFLSGESADVASLVAEARAAIHEVKSSGWKRNHPRRSHGNQPLPA